MRLINGENAMVVACMGSGELMEGADASEWSHLDEGVMVKTQLGALVHIDPAQADLIEFIGRSARS